MEETKLEDLDRDCVENILGRFPYQSLQSLLSWYQATLSPFEIFGGTAYRNVNGIDRSAILLVLPSGCTRDKLKSVSVECPHLKYLALPADVVKENDHVIPGLISKWKWLEILRLRNTSWNLEEIIDQISVHCKDFVGLAVTGAYISRVKATKIATLLPNIKYLILEDTTLDKGSLVQILQGCKKLVQLDVENCIGFDADDREIRKLASQINNFCCYGSKTKA